MGQIVKNILLLSIMNCPTYFTNNLTTWPDTSLHFLLLKDPRLNLCSDKINSEEILVAKGINFETLGRELNRWWLL